MINVKITSIKYMKKKILVTGGDGRFAKVLKTKNKKLNLIFLSKKQCNILNLNDRNFNGLNPTLDSLKALIFLRKHNYIMFSIF